jgi:hypothetical protein
MCSNPICPQITSPLRERAVPFDLSGDSCQQLGARVNLAAKFETMEKENSPHNSPQKSPVKEFKTPSHTSSARRKSSVALNGNNTISSPRDKSRRKSIVTPIPSKVVSVRSKESSRQRRMSLVCKYNGHIARFIVYLLILILSAIRQRPCKERFLIWSGSGRRNDTEG